MNDHGRADGVPRMLGNRYEVGHVLGRGGMAEVHLGRDTRLGRRVAIKMLRADLARDPVFQARFRREAQSAAGLNHPSIVAVYDTGQDVFVESGGAEVQLPYIVMEHLEGRTVRDLLVESGGGGIGTERAVDITAGVLTALDYSHRRGIVHRDIKPANVMITPTGDVKVMDFGIARAVADTSATMTQTSAVIGTAQYLSPEQARGETVDARTDLYSTGCLLYELLTGRPPFVGESPVSVAYQHVREVPRPPSAHNPAVDEALDRVVLKALAKDREDRYADAEEFRVDLLAAEHGQPVAAPAVALATATATQALPTRTEATRALAAAGIATSATGAATSAPALDDGGPGAGGAVPEPAREQPRRRRGVWLWVLLALLLFAVTAFATARYLRTSDDIELADYRDQPVATACASITALELACEETQTADEAAVGTVLDQEPRPGTVLEPGARVILTVSSGPEAVAVPDVSGQTETQAFTTLTGDGFRVGDVVDEPNPDVDEGRIIRTEPAAGEELAPGATVDLVRSSGQVDLPDLSGQVYTDAQEVLGDLGLRATFVFEQTTEVEEGRVLRQDPEPSLVDPGTTVTLVVAQTPPPTPTVTETATPEPTETPQAEESPTSDEEPDDGDDEESEEETPSESSSGRGRGRN
ncbi:Stk1 family PASTA domain-containing Ser/Thr kinase [Quadrisphaera sp. DSM 44207]|uniref:Stk1 family PASTA domain-containing Ser/Thr kinase n=1 Tax=Quadrisphaera sp. DSM 44207 TaxID=1881057 RepID=UPI000886CF6B|nr:Stk1 family PASTA domain-containing Ser/Thr kinase [Quadrisphaera sp. DSM 44207]SDQ22778.1 serine/threonine protein kinase [Quadrisphaera sp. DSM 44207]